mmetsp:Transcript_42377/g.135731  ORF Transcript_42377/g.135731 Transcript_42377/m.135731 type:complete len:271 (+) Transcript_42377:905-1717(+)
MIAATSSSVKSQAAPPGPPPSTRWSSAKLTVDAMPTGGPPPPALGRMASGPAWVAIAAAIPASQVPRGVSSRPVAVPQLRTPGAPMDAAKGDSIPSSTTARRVAAVRTSDPSAATPGRAAAAVKSMAASEMMTAQSLRLMWSGQMSLEWLWKTLSPNWRPLFSGCSSPRQLSTLKSDMKSCPTARTSSPMMSLNAKVSSRGHLLRWASSQAKDESLASVMVEASAYVCTWEEEEESLSPLDELLSLLRPSSSSSLPRVPLEAVPVSEPWP